MVCTSFQAAGGAGQKGIDELAAQVDRVREARPASTTAPRRPRRSRHKVHAKTLAFNVVPLLGSEVEDGYTDEEMKLQNESRKILGHPRPRTSRRRACACRSWSGTPSRCARRSSGASTSTRRWRRCAPSRTSSSTTSPRRWSGRGATRSRSAACARTSYDDHSLNFFVVGDNLLKGAALNTVQIAELLHARGLVGASASAR